MITDEDAQDFARRFKHWRERAGLSQTELAAKLGATTGSVANWERGRFQPRLGGLIEACEILGITMLDFWGPLK